MSTPRLTTTEKTRRRILQGATDCFAHRGFHATTMDELIAAAGMSSSTVYRHFPGGKTELVEAVAKMRKEAILGELQRLTDQTTVPTVREAFLSLMDVLGARDGKAGFTRLARIAVNAWAELPRDQHTASGVSSVYNELHQAARQLGRRWIHSNNVDRSNDLATLVLHQTFGSLAEQALTGDLEVERAAQLMELAVQAVLAPEAHYTRTTTEDEASRTS